MFKKEIEFEDFNGESQTETFYFHLSKMELTRLAAENFDKKITEVIKSEDKGALLEILEDLIRRSVGQRTADGHRFDKSEAAQAAFMQSPAYDELMFELVTNPTSATAFFEALLPAKFREQIAGLGIAKSDTPDPFATPEQFTPVVPKIETVEANWPAYKREQRRATNAELIHMTQQELLEALTWNEEFGKE